MKKAVFIFFIFSLIFLTSFVSAVWYNPWTWFEKDVKMSPYSSNPFYWGGMPCSQVDDQKCDGPFPEDSFSDVSSFSNLGFVPYSTYIGWSCGYFNLDPTELVWGTPYAILYDNDTDGRYTSTALNFPLAWALCGGSIEEDCDEDNIKLWDRRDVYLDEDQDDFTIGDVIPSKCIGYDSLGNIFPPIYQLVKNSEDCDDKDATINPDVDESGAILGICDNKVDDNCNMDFDLSYDNIPETGMDCKDWNCLGASCNPGKPEGQNGNCIDKQGTDICQCCGSGNCEELIKYYEDCDADGFGDKTKSHILCSNQKAAWKETCALVENKDDCDDGKKLITGPGNDDDGNPSTDSCDDDDDGKLDASIGGDDCDDNNKFVNPGILETALFCSDYLDNDCDKDFDLTNDLDLETGKDCLDIGCDGADCTALREVVTKDMETGAETRTNICTDSLGTDKCQCCEGSCEELIKVYADCDDDNYGDKNSLTEVCPNQDLTKLKIGVCNISIDYGDCDDNNASIVPGSRKPGNPCQVCDPTTSKTGEYLVDNNMNGEKCGEYRSVSDCFYEEHNMICCAGTCKKDNDFPLCQGCNVDKKGIEILIPFKQDDWRINSPWTAKCTISNNFCKTCSYNSTMGTYTKNILDRTTIKFANVTGYSSPIAPLIYPTPILGTPNVYDTRYKCCGGDAFDSKSEGCCSGSDSNNGQVYSLTPPYTTKCCQEHTITAKDISPYSRSIIPHSGSFPTNILESVPLFGGFFSWVASWGVDFEVNKSNPPVYVMKPSDDVDYCLGGGFDTGNNPSDSLTANWVGRFDGKCDPASPSKAVNTMLGTVVTAAGLSQPYLLVLAKIIAEYNTNPNYYLGLKGVRRYNRVCYMDNMTIPLIDWTPAISYHTETGECNPNHNIDVPVWTKFKEPGVWKFTDWLFGPRKANVAECPKHHVANDKPEKFKSADLEWCGGTGIPQFDYTIPYVNGIYYCNDGGECVNQATLFIRAEWKGMLKGIIWAVGLYYAAGQLKAEGGRVAGGTDSAPPAPPGTIVGDDVVFGDNWIERLAPGTYPSGSAHMSAENYVA